VSEQILNGTSAQLGYTVPLTSVHAGKYVTQDKSKTDNKKLKRQPKKSDNTKKTEEQNYGGLVQSLLTTLDQVPRWAYSTTPPSPHWAAG